MEGKKRSSESSDSIDFNYDDTCISLPLLDESLEMSLQEDEPASIVIRVLRIAYSVLSSACMILVLRLWGEMTPGYSFFYSCSWAVGVLPFFVIGLLIVRYAPEGSFFWTPKSNMDNSRTALLQCSVLALCYAINYLGVSTSNPHISGPAQVLLQQLPTVFTMVFASAYLQRTYALGCWAGVALILAGTLAQQLMPMILQGHTASEAPIGWVAMNVLGMLPLGIVPSLFEAFSKPRGLDKRRMTPEYRLLWTNALVFVWLLAFSPLFMLLKQPPADKFVSQNRHALECVFEGRLYEEDVPVSTLADPEKVLKLNCPDAGPLLLSTVVIAAAQMHSQLLLSTGESGPLATMLLSFSPFLADIVFPLRPIMGIYTEIPTQWCIVGSVLSFAGCGLFTYFEKRDRLSHKPLRSVRSVSFFLKEDWN